MPIFQSNRQKYLSLGLIPFPASKNGKNPIVPWKGDSIPTNEQYSEWEKKFLNENIWVRLGNDFVVVDPDSPGAEEFVQSLNLPEGPVSISGKKSRHRWFTVAAPVSSLRIHNGNGLSLEVRTGNQGMLVPPSIHPDTGKAYQWLKGQSPWDIPFPELPMEAYERIKVLQKKSEPKMEGAQTENPSLGSLDVKRYLEHYHVKYRIKQLDNARIVFALDRCLFADEHTTPDGKGDSGIMQGSDGKLGYHCFHSHCANKTWKDARNVISGNDSILNFCRGYRDLMGKKDDQEEFTGRLKKAVLSIGELREMEIPEKQKILSPWLSEQSLVMVSGWRGIGKSWFALGLCHAIICGIPFGSWETATPVNILYVDGEMVLSDIKERIDALGDSGKELTGLYLLSDYIANSMGLPKINLLDPKWRKGIKKKALDWNVKLIVLDNLSSLCPGIDENSKQEWDPINQWLLDLRFNGISVIMLHHENKARNQRGTSGREDNLDISISLVQPTDYVPEDGCRFIVKFSKNRIKTKDLPLIADTEFHLKEIDGNLQWTFEETKKKTKIEVLGLLSEGIPPSEIAQKLGLSKGRVSQIKQDHINKGYLTRGGKITELGRGLLNGWTGG